MNSLIIKRVIDEANYMLETKKTISIRDYE